MQNIYSQYPLNLQGEYFKQAQVVIKRLYSILRAGWVDRGVQNPETVGEHTDALVNLAEQLYTIPGLSLMLKIHDWPESDKHVGDRRTDSYCAESKRWTKEQKYEAELKAMMRICGSLGQAGLKIFKLWLEYEEQKTIRSRIAYQLDKFQAIMKAIEYQKMGEPVVAQEFIDHDGGKIKHPILKKMIHDAKSEL